MDDQRGDVIQPAEADARDYLRPAAETDRMEPAPWRVRATLGGQTVFDTTRARYVWEFPYYPQHYIPLEDIVFSSTRAATST